MSSSEIVLKIQRAFQYGESFKVPVLTGGQLKEIMMIMELGQ